MIFWLASYPKSGNTLLRSILGSYFFSQDGDFNFKSLFGNFSLFERKVSQSFLSFFEMLSVNYVNILTNCQLGFADVTSLEKTQVS